MTKQRQTTGKKHLTPQGILDFRFGIDRVERRDGKAYVVDGAGLYAPVEVAGDYMTAEFTANIAKLTELQAATMFEAVRLSPYISREGKQERMTALLTSGKVKLGFHVVAKKQRGQQSEEALG